MRGLIDQDLDSVLYFQNLSPDTSPDISPDHTYSVNNYNRHYSSANNINKYNRHFGNVNRHSSPLNRLDRFL